MQNQCSAVYLLGHIKKHRMQPNGDGEMVGEPDNLSSLKFTFDGIFIVPLQDEGVSVCAYVDLIRNARRVILFAC